MRGLSFRRYYIIGSCIGRGFEFMQRTLTRSLIFFFAREVEVFVPSLIQPLGVSPRSALHGRADAIRRRTIIRVLGVVVMFDGIARRSPTASLRSHTIPRLVPVCGHGAWSASAETLSIAEQCATRGYHDRNLTDRCAGGSAGASIVIVIIKNEFC